jgi:putative transposase
MLELLVAGKAEHKTGSVYQVWGYHPQVIYSDETMQQKIDYIHGNPVRRGSVAAPEHWRYSSAHEWMVECVPAIRCDA